ncbi:phosphopantetheine binding protein, partial [Murinocardiopsis flavida]
LHNHGTTTYLEIGPTPTLTPTTHDTPPTTRTEGRGAPGAAAIPVVRGDRPETHSLMAALGEAHVHGVAVDWAALLPAAKRVDLPTYAFQREHFWVSRIRRAEPESGRAAEAPLWDAVERRDADAAADALAVADKDVRAALDAVLPALSEWRRRTHESDAAAGLCYRVTWRPMPRPEPRPTGAWWVVVPADLRSSDRVRACVEALTRGGAAVRTVLVDDTGRDALARALTRMPPGTGEPDAPAPAGVLSLLAAADDTGSAAGAGATAAALALVQALGDTEVDAPLWLGTRGAVAATGADLPPDPGPAGLWGLGQAVAVEHPERWGGLVDLPDVLDGTGPDTLLGVLTGDTGEDQVALRSSGAYVRRLVRATGQAPRTWAPSGTVAVTGAAGAQGTAVARWLAANGADHVLLLRGGGDPGADTDGLAAELRGLGAGATVADCGPADREPLARLLAELPRERPLTAVVHTPGALPDGVLSSLDPAAAGDAVHAETAAAAMLSDLADDADLAAFVVFSSMAGSFGSGGQGARAAAGAGLAALCERRRAAGLPATSLAWGPWAGAPDEDRLRRSGLPPIDVGTALAAMGTLVNGEQTSVTVADVDWERFAAAFAARRRHPLLADLPDIGSAARGAAADASGGAAEAERVRLAGLSAADRDEAVLDLVLARTAVVLGHSEPTEVVPERGFMEAGVDSLAAVQLRNALTAATGLALPTTLAFDHPSPGALARHLAERIAESATAHKSSPLPELDALESALNGDAVDPAARQRAALRLRSLLARIEEAPGDGDPDTDADVDGASDEELFELINKEFGHS